MKIILTFSGFR